MSVPANALPTSESVIAALTFSWQAADGSSWETHPRLDPAPDAAPTQKYTIPITRGSTQVAISRRVIRSSQAHGLHIEHVTLSLDEGARGQGFATAFWEACLINYRALPLHRVVIGADGDGRLFWARDPVQFERPETPRDLLEWWSEPTTVVAPGPQAFLAAAAERRFPARSAAAFVRAIRAKPQIFTPPGLHGSEFGRLLLSANGWKGIVELRPWTPPEQ